MLKVGRLEFEFTAADSVSRVEQQGETISLVGWVTRIAEGALSAAAAAEVLNAYQSSPDEPFIPVVWDALPNITGFYRVLSARLTGEGAGVALRGMWSLSLDLERVRGFAAPLIESRLLGAKRAGVAAGVTAVPWHAVPLGTSGYESSELPAGQANTQVTGETGSLVVVTDTPGSAFNSTVSYYLSPASWHAGAATLKVAGQVVVGRQCRNLPADWSLSNGLVRVSPVAATPHYLTVERWTGTAWASLGNWQMGLMFGGPPAIFDGLHGPHALTVLRNAPECAAVRLTCGALFMGGGLDQNYVTVDLSLRRGSKVVEVAVSSRASLQHCVAAPFNLSTGTAGTGGVANAANGLAVAHGSGVVSGSQLQLAAAGQRLVYGLGHVAGTVDAAAVTAWVSKYAAAQVESVRAVAR